MPLLLLGLRYLLLVILYIFIFRVVLLIIRDLQKVGNQVSLQQASSDNVEPSIGYGGALVVVNSGTGPIQVGHKCVLPEVLTIGRNEDSDLTITDNFTSQHHARIYWLKDNYWLEDLGSTNGTYVNGHRITRETMLIDRDQVKIGSVTFQFVRWEYATQ